MRERTRRRSLPRIQRTCVRSGWLAGFVCLLEAKACETTNKKRGVRIKVQVDLRRWGCPTRAFHLEVTIAVLLILFFLAVIILLICDGRESGRGFARGLRERGRVCEL